MKRNIVLCSSMKVKDDLFRVANALKENGHNVLLPKECIEGLPKKIASRAHFDRITNVDNDTILVVNATKNGIKNYIGPNSFAEIAMAFYNNKDVFLLNDIYEPYKDEILGWGVKCLHGNLNLLKENIEMDVVNNLIKTFEKLDTNLATKYFIVSHNDNITNKVREYLDGLSKKEVSKILEYLNHLLNVCYDYKLYDDAKQKDDTLIAKLSKKELFLFKETIIYFIGRLNLLPDIEILKKVYYLDDNKYIKLNVAFTSLLTFDEEIELDFSKLILSNDEYNLMLRSWTMAFFANSNSPYDYVDKGIDDWAKAKMPRIKRLTINEESDYKYKKAMAFRLFDLIVLYIFLENRNESLTNEEKDIIKNANINYKEYSDKKKELLNDLKQKIILR